jgi:hypothetical protein
LRAKSKRVKNNKLDSFIGWLGWYRLSAMDRRSKLVLTFYIYDDDRRTWYRPNYLTYTQLAHYLAIIGISASAFGFGVGQFIGELVR